MNEVPATEFAKHFGRYKEVAQREPVAITSHGRTTGYFVAEHEYAEYQRLNALNRRVYQVNELSEETIKGWHRADGPGARSPKHDSLTIETGRGGSMALPAPDAALLFLGLSMEHEHARSNRG